MRVKKMRKCSLAALFVFLVAVSGVSAQEPNAAAAALENPGKPIEKLEFQGADIRSVIYFLADYGKVNVVVSPDVSGTVTIAVRNVTWKQGLDIIGRTYDLAIVYEQEGYIRVLPAPVYREEVTSNEKHKMEKLTLTPLKTEIIRINNSTSDDVSNAVAGLLTSRGRVISDPRTNSLILREIPEKIPEIKNFISQLDLPPRQIMISAKLIEVNSKFLREWGTRLGFTTTGSIGRNTISQDGVSDGVTGRVSDPFGSYTLNLLHPDYSLDGLLEAVESSGKGRILAHPEITTIENKEARIQMGQKIPIKQFDASGNVTTIFEEVGTILRVTPHITADDMILMELHPERSFAEIGPQGVIISTNNASTTVVVKNNQTAVIGGLTTEDENVTKSGIPFLKDIPIVGFFFSYTKKTRESRDLIIFVTPTIIENSLASSSSGAGSGAIENGQ